MTSLKAEGLRPGGPPAAVVATMGGKYTTPLYRRDCARAKQPATAAQLAALAKGRATIERKRIEAVTCVVCKVPESLHYRGGTKICPECEFRQDLEEHKDHLRELADSDDWLALDVETTGLDEDCRIVEIAVVSAQGEPLCDYRVNPEMPIPAEATAIHGITDADVANCPTWRQVAPYVLATLRKASRVVAYNASFDRAAVAAECRRAGLHPPPMDWECVMQSLSFVACGSRRWVSLAEVCSSLRIKAGTHTAQTDAHAVAACVRHFQNDQGAAGESGGPAVEPSGRACPI